VAAEVLSDEASAGSNSDDDERDEGRDGLGDMATPKPVRNRNHRVPKCRSLAALWRLSNGSLTALWRLSGGSLAAL
jgi:hypothetical protein